MALGDSDLALFTSDFGAPVVWGSYTTQGVLDAPDDMLAQGMVISTSFMLVYQSATLPGLDADDAITVNGVPYVVKYVRAQADGAYSHAYLETP